MRFGLSAQLAARPGGRTRRDRSTYRTRREVVAGRLLGSRRRESGPRGRGELEQPSAGRAGAGGARLGDERGSACPVARSPVGPRPGGPPGGRREAPAEAGHVGSDGEDSADRHGGARHCVGSGGRPDLGGGVLRAEPCGAGGLHGRGAGDVLSRDRQRRGVRGGVERPGSGHVGILDGRRWLPARRRRHVRVGLGAGPRSSADQRHEHRSGPVRGFGRHRLRVVWPGALAGLPGAWP